jgi:hypothetical protein
MLRAARRREAYQRPGEGDLLIETSLDRGNDVVAQLRVERHGSVL